MNRTMLIIGASMFMLLLQSCLVSRCAQPKITGYVYDRASKKPVEECLVGGQLTDANGFYQFEEMRYREFTFIGMEAPPVHVELVFSKDEYANDTIVARNPFGGGMRKGAHWEMDTVFLIQN